MNGEVLNDPLPQEVLDQFKNGSKILANKISPLRIPSVWPKSLDAKALFDLRKDDLGRREEKNQFTCAKLQSSVGFFSIINGQTVLTPFFKNGQDAPLTDSELSIWDASRFSELSVSQQECYLDFLNQKRNALLVASKTNHEFYGQTLICYNKEVKKYVRRKFYYTCYSTPFKIF